MEVTIYQQLGAENLQLLVNAFYDRIEQDERINHLFKTDMEIVRQKQFMFLTQFLGGPPLYSKEFGHPRMRMRHMPHAITVDAALAWLDNMKDAIDSLPITPELKEEVYSAFPRLAGHMINS